jgi:YfiH family protein
MGEHGAEPPLERPSPVALRVERWQIFPGLFHGFLGREGGVSVGALRSLNLSEQVGDDPKAVAANARIVQSLFPALRLVRMQQAHGACVVHVKEPSSPRPVCDAVMTGVAGLGLSVLTADCVPILMIAPARRVAVAVHAGWRGTLAGIAAAAIESACATFGLRAQDLWASLGPAVGGCCYEVDAEIGGSLESRWGAMPEAWSRAGSKGRLDLRRANRRLLLGAGLPAEQINEVGPCTACAESDFFSHRRSGGHTGRQLSVVGWEAGA